MRRSLLTLAAAVLAAAALAAPAAAHIQVRPTLAAPGDPVLFEFIVPGERDSRTVEVTIQIPKDVIPFSFEDPAGWKRSAKEAADGSVSTITWKGELAPDGFGRFSLLASTPEQEGEIVWKALQTYDDGHVARWIGKPDSDNPAPVTTVSKSAPRQNAGGESAPAASASPAPSATATAAAASAASAASASAAAPAAAPVAGDGDSPLGAVLGGAALLVALAALGVALRGRRKVPA